MKKIKKLIADLGLSYKNEMAKLCVGIAVCILLGLVLFVITRQIVLLLLGGIGAPIFVYAIVFSYEKRLASIRKDEENELIRLIGFFSVFIGDGFNVYVSLQKITAFATGGLKTKLEQLIADIDSDKSVTPFVTFSASFENITIKEALLSIYQMVDEGTNGAYLSQFKHVFSRLSDQRYSSIREKTISSLDTFSFLPLASSGIAMIALVMALMDIMGKALYVL